MLAIIFMLRSRLPLQLRFVLCHLLRLMPRCCLFDKNKLEIFILKAKYQQEIDATLNFVINNFRIFLYLFEKYFQNIINLNFLNKYCMKK